jgi:16S rRNA (adenine1518-N6/adenine1519-N6)-dimethyltransferase
MMVLLVQREVAQRIIAADKKESLLSLSVKAYGNPKIIGVVSAGSFFPKPNVDSAILAIYDISKDFFAHFTEEQFFGLIHAGFAQKRKLLRRNLESAYSKENIDTAFTAAETNPNARAENLSLAEWSKLAACLEKSQQH